MQNLLFKYKLFWWQSILITLLLLSIYHFLQPKPQKFGMINIQEISQDFLQFIAIQTLTKEQQAKQIEIFGKTLSDEINKLSKEVVLFESREVVTPLPDYTKDLKYAIAEAFNQD